MINLLLGAPGGGKSYEAVVYHVLPALEKGRKVITNLPLDLARFEALNSDWVELIEIWDVEKGVRPFSLLEHYGDPWRHPKTGAGPLYVIDECHLALPVGQTKREVEEWYSLHRHESADVLLITQSYGKISKAIRDLVQIVYRVRKNTALGSQSSYTRKVQDGLRGEVVNSSIRKYEKKYFALYKSHTRGGGSELSANDVKPVWQHWSFIGTGIFAAIFVFLVVTGRFHMPWTKPDSKEPKSAKIQTPAAAFASAQAKTIPAAHTKPQAQAVPEPVPKASATIDAGPYAQRQMHIMGRMQQGKRDRLVVAVSQNGQMITVTDSDSLQRAGYKVTILDDCVATVTYEKTSRHIICDAPQVGIGFNSAATAAAASITQKPAAAPQSDNGMGNGPDLATIIQSPESLTANFTRSSSKTPRS